MHLPVIEYQCKHSEPKVVRREYFDDFLITAVDLCKDCLKDPLFSKKATFVDKKVISRKKLNTKSALKKTIAQRKNEIKHLEERKDEILNIGDSLEKIPKLTEYYMDLSTLTEELNRLYGMYVKLLDNNKKKLANLQNNYLMNIFPLFLGSQYLS